MYLDLNKMYMNKLMKIREISFLFLATLLLFSSCTEVPSLGSIAPDVRYKNRKQYAVSGLEQNIGEFLGSSSTLPLNFKIVDLKETKGGDVSTLKQEIPVLVYTAPIVGNETPAELALKTDTIMKPAVSLNAFTGKVEILQGNNIPAGEYRFDIAVSNSSGETILKDAIIIEFKEFELRSWSSGMTKAPEITRVADKPNQILFVGHLDGKPLPGNRIDFTSNRSNGFKGTFVDDKPEGEIWSVDFPVKPADTNCSWKIMKDVDGVQTPSYITESMNFVLGRPGSYVIKLYK